MSGEGPSGAADASPIPLFIRLSGRKTLVVGGGSIAEHKVELLLEYGADVIVVSPDATPQLQEHARNGRLQWVRRRWVPDDGEGAMLVVSATGDRAIDEAVYAQACERGQLVNVVDVPQLCNAIVPSIVRRGRLQIAVSTSGASPSTAREIRRELEREFPEYWEEYLDLMAEVRCLVKRRVPGPMSRRAPLYEAIQGSDVRERIERGETLDAEWVYDRIVSPLLEGESV